MAPDWETLCKRLLVAMQLGIRVDQEDGHRWIHADKDASFFPRCLLGIYSKEYGSYSAALDRVDKVLTERGERTLLDRFTDSIDYNGDLGTVFGEGVQ